MAVRLRLKRMGAKKRPYYRIVAADSRAANDGKIIEQLGTYNPLTDSAEIKVDEEKVLNGYVQVLNQATLFVAFSAK